MFRVVTKLKAFTALLLVFMVAVAAIAPQAVSAAPGNPPYCDSQVERLTNQNIQNKVPVIMVHGFTGSSRDWGSITNPNSFAGKVNAIPGVAVAHLFNYNSYDWVDNPDAGPKLAKTIDCVSQLSVRSGGKGKVIIVANSLGGLVARDAVGRRSPDGQRAVADEIGQAITIGTPHIGTTLPLVTGMTLGTIRLAEGITPGSAQLTALPHFPAQTAVHTIAGDVTRVYYDRQGREIKREQPHDDTLVTTLSAHAEYSIDVNKGGGQKTFACEKRYYLVPFVNYPVDLGAVPCEHGQLAHDPTNGVREDTVEAIKKYVASLSAPATTNLTVGTLTTRFDNRWTNIGYGAGGPGRDGSAWDSTNGVPCTNCTTTPNPTVYAFVDVFNYADWCTGPVQQCAVGSSTVVGTAPPVTIGGRTPSFSARYLDSGYTGTSLVWCFEDQKVCVHYRRAADRPQLEPSAALLDMFSTATWANP